MGDVLDGIPEPDDAPCDEDPELAMLEPLGTREEPELVAEPELMVPLEERDDGLEEPLDGVDLELVANPEVGEEALREEDVEEAVESREVSDEPELRELEPGEERPVEEALVSEEAAEVLPEFAEPRGDVPEAELRVLLREEDEDVLPEEVVEEAIGWNVTVTPLAIIAVGRERGTGLVIVTCPTMISVGFSTTVVRADRVRVLVNVWLAGGRVSVSAPITTPSFPCGSSGACLRLFASTISTSSGGGGSCQMTPWSA